MNGITPPLLVLLILAQLSSAQSIDPLAQPNNEFGWEIDKNDGALVFIVQVLPEEAKAIQNVQAKIDEGVRTRRPAMDPQTGRQLEPLEVTASMPPELIGRVSRVSIRVGSTVLPRVPSIAKIRQMPRYGTQTDLSQAMGPGKLSDFESDELVPVQGNGGLPQLPFTDNSRGVGQTGNLPDQARQLSESAREGMGSIAPPSLDTVGEAARRAGSSIRDSFLSDSRSSANRQPPATNNPSRFSDTAPPDLPATSTTSGSSTAWNPSLADRGANSPQARIADARRSDADVRSNRGSLGSGLPSDYPDLRNDYAARDTNNNQFGLGADNDYGRRPPTDGFGASPNPNRQESYNYPTAADRRIAGNQERPSTSPQSGYASNTASANPNYDPRTQQTATNPYAPLASQYAANPNNANPAVTNAVNPNTYQPGAIANAGYAPSQQFQQPGYGQQMVATNQGYGIPGQAGVQTQPPYAGPLRAGVQSQVSTVPVDALLAAFEKGKESAANETESPSARGKNNAEQSPGQTPSGRQSDSKDKQIADASPFAKTRDIFVKMFFLVSLLANCYLAYLIRKLLMRYRSLLSTVRSHAVA